MSSLVLCVGRILFFALIITQCFLLASYPATYKDNSAWYAVAITYVFSVIPWAGLVLFSAAKLRRLFYIWALYVFGFVASIAIVFGTVGDSLDKGRTIRKVMGGGGGDGEKNKKKSCKGKCQEKKFVQRRRERKKIHAEGRSNYDFYLIYKICQSAY